jgi:hypothetical protein
MANRSGKPIIKDGTIVGLSSSDIPIFTKKKTEPVEPVEPEEPVKKEEQTVEVNKENITEIQVEENIVISEASGETIPPITKGKRGFPVRKTKTEDISKYDEKAELAFKEKRLDGGDF